MRKTSLLLAIILLVSFTATAEMAGPGPEAELQVSVSGNVESSDTQAVSQAVQRHTVRSGDTLWDIALDNSVPLAELLAANRLTSNSLLSVGQILIIPDAAAGKATSAAPVSSVGAAAEMPAPSVRYRVQRGNTLWDIAVAYGVTVEAVMKANQLNKDSILAVGQEVVIPAPQRTPPVGALDPSPLAPPSSSLAQPSSPAQTSPLEAASPVTATQVVSETVPVEAPPEISATDGISGEVGLQATTVPVLDAADGSAVTEAPPVEAVAPPPNEMALLVFTLINEKRAGHGMSPLAWSPVLAQAAQAHAEDCARRNFGSHVGSDGARLRERLARVGYRPFAASENWVYAHSPGRGVEWWYNEPPGRDPHRRNILSSQYAEVGIGIVQDESGLYYIVADFGRS